MLVTNNVCDMMTLNQIYVNKFKELVKKERDHEINFHKEEIKKLGTKRENVGRAILNLNGKVLREFFGEYIVGMEEVKNLRKPIFLLEISF